MGDDGPAGIESPSVAGDASLPLKVFINYRRILNAADAQLLYDRLKAHFGPENVFFDRASIRAGEKWLEEIKAHGTAAGVFLVLIGRNWATVLNEKAQESALRGELDYVRIEIEMALKQGVRVVPVLIDGERMPDEDDLHGSLRHLRKRHAVELHHGAQFDTDVDYLIKEIRSGVTAGPPPLPQPLPPAPPPQLPTPFDHLVPALIRGEVVLFIGAGANTSDGGDGEGSDYPPDGRELASGLAGLLPTGVGVASDVIDLARVSQYVEVTRRRGPLDKALTQLTSGCSPTEVHRFLARLPSMLKAVHGAKRHQLIVTMNYDDALEQAFEEAEEDYDLLVYMASGENRGRFLHVPHDGEPAPITDPDGLGFPIGDAQVLNRSVIVKIHGAVENKRQAWKENYVITEDDYITYLSQRQIDQVLPKLILAKLRGSYCLFLGYTIRDWNLRVFLRRLWGDQTLKFTSWAIDPVADDIERGFWKELVVDLHAASLGPFLGELEGYLAAAAHMPASS
jgi:hypothetical protein